MRLGKPIPLLSLLALAVALQAQEADPRFRFGGFGTLGAVATGTHQVGFGRDTTEYAHATDHPQPGVDSRIGLQWSSRLSDTLLWTFQVLAKNQYDNTWRPQVEWACLAWSPAPGWLVKAGRLGLEGLPNGDFANVGYTYLWVRPPVELFGGTNPSYLNGLELTRSFERADGTTIDLKLLGGFMDEKFAVNNPAAPYVDTTGSTEWTAALKARRGPVRGRLAYSQVRFAKEYGGAASQAFRDALASFSTFLNDPRPAQVAASTELRGTVVRQVQLGVSWDSGRIQADAAVARQLIHHLGVPNSWKGFVSLGCRFGQVEPYAVWARAVSDRNPPPDLGPLASLPGPLAPALVQTIDSTARAGDVDQNTLSAGLRWDFADHAAFKVQVDRVRAHNSTALWWVREPGWDGKATVMSVAVDFIFGAGR